MVAVVVGVHQRPQGQVGHRPEGTDEGFRACLGEAGVNDSNCVFADEEAGIAQSPASVELDVGEDALADFLDSRCRDLVARRWVGCAHVFSVRGCLALGANSAFWDKTPDAVG